MSERIVRDRFFIGGTWVAPRESGSFAVVNPSTEEVLGSVPAGTPADVDDAVAAARAAFPAWSARAPHERAALLRAIGRGLVERQEELALLIARELGAPLSAASKIHVGLPILTLGFYADLLERFAFEETVGHSLIVKEPVGVVAAITPWNYPLHQVIAKVAPALAAGCTVVLKPSEVVPLACFALAEIVERAALPAGVFNLLSGSGPVVGEAMARHPGVDMVSFTGSTRAGKRVAELAAASVKRVALELGGKSANVILDDADLEKAVRAGVQQCYSNSGQMCTAWSRMLVPEHRQDDAIRIAKDEAEHVTVGDPVRGGAKLGPLVSATQRDRVRGYIQRGLAEGARLVTGGVEPPDGLARGYFVRPTVLADVRNDMTVAQEEIFGPVLCIVPYRDEEDAVRIANETVYGLGGAVWSNDRARAERVARRIRTGQVHVNGAPFNPAAPFGGMKQSGRGRELGVWGLEEYLEPKALHLPS
ncbi:MAG: aldehyde dehydrogenase family protein [bacterium]